MCLNCGCGEYDKRHKRTDITMEELKAAAMGQGMELSETAAELELSARVIEQTALASEEESPV
jgi:hypothetical protein